MRLIDANLLEKFFYKEVRHYPFSGDVNCILVDHVLHTVRNFPTIDAVPVIRCKNCKHWNIREGNDPTRNYFCNRDGMWCKPIRKPTDFCSYGERKK